MIADVKPRLGEACGLGHSPTANLSVSFFYSEYVLNDHWEYVETEVPLAEGTHYSDNLSKGQITLLPHSLWTTVGRYRAADTMEPMLYKGRVTRPQRVEATFDIREPIEVGISLDKDQVSQEDLTISITADSDGDTPIAIYSEEGKIGAVMIAVAGGVGSHVLSVGANVPAGSYTFMADPEVIDPIWNLPQYQTDGIAQVEVA